MQTWLIPTTRPLLVRGSLAVSRSIEREEAIRHAAFVRWLAKVQAA